MKRKFIMILALTSIFSSITPVFAKTDKEILLGIFHGEQILMIHVLLYQKQTYMAQQWKG